jgi:preprotein translocase subunit SecA
MCGAIIVSHNSRVKLCEAVEATRKQCFMLKVLAIPPNKPCIRKDYPRQLHRTDAAAMKRRDRIIEQACLSGRPLLIGTATTSASESIYKSVKKTLETARESIMFKIEYERMLQQGVFFSSRPHA